MIYEIITCFVCLVLLYLVYVHFTRREDQILDKLLNPKSRGDLGERILIDLLKQVGLIEGKQYLVKTKNIEGNIPDVTLLLPNSLKLSIDAKFPLHNYKEYVRTGQKEFLTKFQKDMRAPVKDIIDRGYINSETIDFAVLFLPNDLLLAIILEQDHEYVDYCLSQKVVVCTPSTLYAIIAFSNYLSGLVSLPQDVIDKAKLLSNFAREIEKFKDEMNKVSKNVDQLSSNFASLQGTRLRQLEKALKKVDVEE